MKQFWVVFCLLISNYSAGQLIISFEDSTLNNETQYPENRWIITSENPLQGNYSLRHYFDSPESSRDRISFSYETGFTEKHVIWRFQVRYGYNPSGSNNWGVFIMADTSAPGMHPSGSVNGYVIGVNYSGSDDMIKLWKIVSGSGYEIINTQFNWQDEISPGTTVGMEIQRFPDGQWMIRADKNGGFDDLSLTGTGQNLDYNSTEHFGIFYEYTSSADSELWIDDISVHSYQNDTIPPEIVSDSTLSASMIKLQFSEEMDSASLFNSGNYTLNGESVPSQIETDDHYLSSARLIFEKSFQDSASNELKISGLKDKKGNHIRDTSIAFRYYQMQITEMKVLSEDALSLTFSRTPDSATAFKKTNYLVNNNIGSPVRIRKIQTQPFAMKLTFDTSFRQEARYKLEAKDILDIWKDPMKEFTGHFLFRKIQKNDVVISEIMADPSPSAGLPEYEYLELFNTTEYPVNLANWIFSAGSRSNVLPDSTLAPGEFIILCDAGALTEFADYGKTFALESFPALKNTGARLEISDTTGQVINSVEYTDEWYQDSEKEDGGYSLEKIDPRNNCSGADNWEASENQMGGTPGSINSIFANNIDNKAPELTDFQIINSTQLRICFNEPLHPEAEDSYELFSVNHGVGTPFSIIRENTMKNTYNLIFQEEFIQNGQYTFYADGIYDKCLNDTTLSIDFTYHEPQPYDILINEVMADPSPQIELPEEEYIELYNRSGYTISLHQWKIFAGKSYETISKSSIPDQGYVIICEKENEKVFQKYGKTIGLESMPSISNSGELLYLQSKKGRVIDFVEFHPDWHENDYKKEGGWSLELIDPMNPCGQQGNWSSSLDTRGGTPGTANSVAAKNPDKSRIEINYVAWLDSSKIAVRFDEPYKRFPASETQNYEVKNFGQPEYAEIVPPHFNTVNLTFAKSFKRNTRYLLKVEAEITDCAGNSIESGASCEFERPEKPANFDIIINELLFNPKQGAEDFVELYNRSDKTIEISELCLGNEKNDYRCLHEYDRLFFPGEYLVLTENTGALKEQYFIPNSQNLLQADDIPSYKNTAGIVHLTDKAQQSIDLFEYNESMHFPLLNSTKGVSLERIHYDKQTNDNSNWHSAADGAGYATPGYKNSQFTQNSPGDKKFQVDPEVFSPDNDGRDDLLAIHYNLKKAGYAGTVRIFNARGRMVRRLVNNKTFNTEGTIHWNGLTDRGEKAKMGIYVIYIEIFDKEGNVEQIKKRCVVGG